MERKAKEVPAVTKPMGDERKVVKPGKGDRPHPMDHMGYKGVGKSVPGADGSERTDKMIAKKDPARHHPMDHMGYKGVGKSAPGADGKERTEGAYKKKSPWRNA